MKNLFLLFALTAFLFQPQTAIAVERAAQSNIEAVAAAKPTEKAKRLERLQKRLERAKEAPLKVHPLSILAFVCALTIILAPIALLLGRIALKRIKENPEKWKGKGLVIAAFVLCGLCFAVFTVFSIIEISNGFLDYFGSFTLPISGG